MFFRVFVVVFIFWINKACEKETMTVTSSFLGFGNITPKTQLGQGVTMIVCLVGIPVTMLALKSAGDLVARSIRLLIIKLEAGLFKTDTTKHLKAKVFFVTSILIVILLLFLTVLSIHMENWSLLQSLYAWYTTFTTVGFGDFIPTESLTLKAANGEVPQHQVTIFGIFYSIPVFTGLSLVSCLLSVIVDSVDNLRDFVDRYDNCFPCFFAFLTRFFRCRLNCGFKVDENHTHTDTEPEADLEQNSK